MSQTQPLMRAFELLIEEFLDASSNPALISSKSDLTTNLCCVGKLQPLPPSAAKVKAFGTAVDRGLGTAGSGKLAYRNHTAHVKTMDCYDFPIRFFFLSC